MAYCLQLQAMEYGWMEEEGCAGFDSFGDIKLCRQSRVTQIKYNTRAVNCKHPVVSLLLPPCDPLVLSRAVHVLWSIIRRFHFI